MAVNQIEYAEWRGRRFELFFQNEHIYGVYLREGSAVPVEEYGEFIVFLESLSFRDIYEASEFDDEGNEIEPMLGITFNSSLLYALRMLPHHLQTETPEMRHLRESAVRQWKELTENDLAPFEFDLLVPIWQQMTGREFYEWSEEKQDYLWHDDAREDCYEWIRTHGLAYLKEHPLF